MGRVVLHRVRATVARPGPGGVDVVKVVVVLVVLIVLVMVVVVVGLVVVVVVVVVLVLVLVLVVVVKVMVVLVVLLLLKPPTLDQVYLLCADLCLLSPSLPASPSSPPISLTTRPLTSHLAPHLVLRPLTSLSLGSRPLTDHRGLSLFGNLSLATYSIIVSLCFH